MQATDVPSEFETEQTSLDIFLDEAEEDSSVLVWFSPVPASAASGVTIQGQVEVDRLLDYREYAWDHRNRLVWAVIYQVPDGVGTAEDPPGLTAQPRSVVSYQYDVLGNRIAKVIDGTVGDQPHPVDEVPDAAEDYVHENGHLLLEFDEQRRLERQQLYAQAVDQLLAVEDFSYSGETRSSQRVIWTLADQQGSITELSAEGATPEWLEYDSFGSVTGGGSLAASVKARYTGRESDPETGLFYYRARYYDPRSGRFLDSADHPVYTKTLPSLPLGKGQTAGTYRSSTLTQDLYIEANHPSSKVEVRFHFPEVGTFPPTIQVDGAYYLDRFEGYQEYTWDYHNRLSEARMFGAPTTASPGASGPIKENVVWVGTVRYGYDVLGNLIAREKHTNEDHIPEDAEYYVRENGREVFSVQRAPFAGTVPAVRERRGCGPGRGRL